MTDHVDTPDDPNTGNDSRSGTPRDARTDDDVLARLWRSAEPVPRRDQLAAERLVRRLQTEAVALAERHRVRGVVRGWQLTASVTAAALLVVLGLWLLGGDDARNEERAADREGPVLPLDPRANQNTGRGHGHAPDAPANDGEPGPSDDDAADSDPPTDQVDGGAIPADDGRDWQPMPPDANDDGGPVVISAEPVARTTLASMYSADDAWVYPDAPTLQLPVMVARDSIRNHAALLAAMRGEGADALNQLATHGFVVGKAAMHDDPVDFYRHALADRLPVMITIDVALHLAHARLDATRRAVEEAELAPRLRRTMRSMAEQLAALEGRYPAGSDADRALTLARRFVAVACAFQAAAEAEAFVRPAHCCAIAMRVSGPGMNYFYPEMWSALSEFNATLPAAQQVDVDGYLSGRDLRFLLDAYVNAERERVLREQMPDLADDVLLEVNRVLAADEIRPSEILGRTLDYTVFRVPDRYTRAPILANYWRTLEWLRQARIPLAWSVRGTVAGRHHGMEDGPVDPQDRRRALAGLFTVDSLLRVRDDTTRDDASSTAAARSSSSWRRLVTAIDFTDGLTEWGAPFLVRAVTRHVLGSGYSLADLGRPGVVDRLCNMVARSASTTMPLPDGPRESMQTFFGRPDRPGDYAMQRMAAMRDSERIGAPPDPMELLAALGSDRAAWQLQSGFPIVAGEEPWRALRPEFEQMSTIERHGTPARDWMTTLFSIVRPEGRSVGYPAFMTSDAYSDRLLHAALGSYVRQHPDADVHMFKTRRAWDEDQDPFAHPDSTVEPLPHVYSAILAVVNHTRVGLARVGVLPPAEQALLQRTEQTLERLITISRTVLAGHAIGDEDRIWISRFADRLEPLTSGEGRAAMMAVTTIRSDVTTADRGHTRIGTGGVRPMWVLTRTPSGEIVAVVGCVSSYYRLTDVDDRTPRVEQWRRDLRAGLIHSPEWTGTFVTRR